MREELIRCPICEVIVGTSLGGKVERIAPVHGICWKDMGYSLGGWGCRRDFGPDFAGEVCTDCFNTVKPKIDALMETVSALKGSRRTEVWFQRIEPAEHHVPAVRNDQPQSQRHPGAVLRALQQVARHGFPGGRKRKS
jgi:hypothetical protein